MKERIEEIYLEATKKSSLLREIVMTKVPGSKDVEYKAFVRLFGYLFDISKQKSDLDIDIVKACKKWTLTPKSSPSTKNIMKALELYDRYTEELFRMKVLTYDK